MFEKIKIYLSSPPVLKAPRRGVPFRLYVAAEDKVIGAVLTQDSDQPRVAMGEVHEGICGTHQSAPKMKWLLRRAGF